MKNDSKQVCDNVSLGPVISNIVCTDTINFIIARNHSVKICTYGLNRVYG